MATEPHHFDISIGNLVAGICGSFVSLRFMQGTLTERGTMAIGGSALSYYGTAPASAWLGMASAEGLVGFLLGLFGMAVVAKVYEGIQSLPAARIVEDAWESLKRRLGG